MQLCANVRVFAPQKTGISVNVYEIQTCIRQRDLLILYMIEHASAGLS